LESAYLPTGCHKHGAFGLIPQYYWIVDGYVCRGDPAYHS
jgi:hypothetical protein